MKNTINKRGQKHGLWQTLNKAKTFLIEENYKNGILHGKHTEIYKGDWFRKQFYMNGQLFGETVRNDKLLIQKFYEPIDGGEWKIDEIKYPHSKFWFVGEKCIFEYNEKYHILHITYDGFWSVFMSEFISRQEVLEFIIGQVEEYFKLNVGIIQTGEYFPMHKQGERQVWYPPNKVKTLKRQVAKHFKLNIGTTEQ